MGSRRAGAVPLEAGARSLIRRRTAALAFAFAAGVAVVFGGVACGQGSGVRAAVGQPAPTFSTFDLDGRAVDLAGFRGRTVLLNFWASWCIPCRAEFPVLRHALDSHPGLVVLGVVFQDGRGPAADFLRDQHATWPGLVDPKGQIAKGYGVAPKPGIPVTFAIGPDGVVRARHLGPLQSDADVERLLAGRGGAP